MILLQALALQYLGLFLYRGLLDDAQFHDCIQCLDDEPIPYFQQYSDRVPERYPTPMEPLQLPEQTPTGRLPQDENPLLDDLLNEEDKNNNTISDREPTVDSGPSSASRLQQDSRASSKKSVSIKS